MRKKNFIYPEKDHWLTQAVLKRNEVRLLMKLVLTDSPYSWVNWTDEQHKEYKKEHMFHQ